MTRPRLLLVAEFTELQWAIKPLLEEWAEVISYDLPGVGVEPLPAGVGSLGELTREIATRHAIEKLEQAGWSRYVLVADGWGVANAVGIAETRPRSVAGMALGHATLSYARDGERAPINGDVYDAFTQLINQDAPAFVRYGIAQLTKGGVDDELAQRMIERVPAEFMVAGWAALTADQPFAHQLQALDCPLLLAKHEGCLMNTDEGFEDAVSALPRAAVATFEDPPAASSAFADALRDFCQRCWDGTADG